MPSDNQNAVHDY